MCRTCPPTLPPSPPTHGAAHQMMHFKPFNPRNSVLVITSAFCHITKICYHHNILSKYYMFTITMYVWILSHLSWLRPHLKLKMSTICPKIQTLKIQIHITFWMVALNVRDAMKMETNAIVCEWSLLTVDIYFFAVMNFELHETYPSAQVKCTRNSLILTNLSQIVFL